MLNTNVILEALTGSPSFGAGSTPALTITEAAIDSRQIIQGALFIAIRGEKVDGHDFVTQSFQKGAAAALIEREIDTRQGGEGGFGTRPYPEIQIIDLRTAGAGSGQDAGSCGVIKPARALIETTKLIQSGTPICFLVDNTVVALQKIAAHWRQQLGIRVIGITGSVGKSTSKEAIAQVLSQRYITYKSAANLNNEIGLPLSILKLTPGHQRAVLEMGFYVPGEIKFLCDIAHPQVGVLTNIGTVHAERAGSQEVIAAGKGELVEALPIGPEGIAILNYDDPFIRPMNTRTKARVFYYGLTSEADLWADHVDGNGLKGIRLQLHYKNETLHLSVPMIGRHSVETVLRAAAVGLVEGLSWDEIVRGLQESQVAIRLSAVRTESGALLIDDTYNASPESTMAALNLLGELRGSQPRNSKRTPTAQKTAGRKIAVLGDMLELGQYERVGHEKIGIRAAQVADLLVTLGVRAHIIAKAAKTAGMKQHNVIEFEDINLLIEWLKKNLSSDDAVLVKGSHGLRMDRIVTALEIE